MADETVAAATRNDSDPLRSISDAMREAIANASDDAARAQEKLRAASDGLGNSASRFAYTSSYMLSYGIVYASVFVARSVPQDNPIVEGFIDGGRAAIEALNDARGGSL